MGMLDRKILNGVIDLHIHTGPSVAKRKVDVVEMMIAAEEAGYAGFLVKDHYAASAHGCLMVEKHISQKGCKAFSSIVMNNAVGGFNIMALDVAYNMGTRMVYMPTVSSRLHIEDHRGRKFLGAGNVTQEENEIYCLKENGELTDEVIAFLQYVAEHKDLVLSTGHISWQETDVLIPKAFELGVKNIIVNHPNFTVNAPLEITAKWGKLGAFIEITACEFGMVLKDDDTHFNSLDLVDRYIEAGVPFDQMFIVSDFGQSISPHPVDGLYKFIRLLHDKRGYSVEQLEKLTKKTPARIIGFNN